MDVIFDGVFRVHYGQAYVLSNPDGLHSDLDEAFVGQQNGLLGASVPRQLWLTTGLHTGNVRMHIAKAKAEPPLDDAWEDVVEASFAPESEDAALTGWGGEVEPVALMLDTVSYRVRLCASGMDKARQQDTLLHGEEPIDSYSLAFWRAEPGPDRVVKQTSAAAAYWHDWAQRL